MDLRYTNARANKPSTRKPDKNKGIRLKKYKFIESANKYFD